MLRTWRRSLFWDRFKKIRTFGVGEKISTFELPKSWILVGFFYGFRWFFMKRNRMILKQNIIYRLCGHQTFFSWSTKLGNSKIVINSTGVFHFKNTLIQQIR